MFFECFIGFSNCQSDVQIFNSVKDFSYYVNIKLNNVLTGFGTEVEI